MKDVFLKSFVKFAVQKNTCARVSFLIKLQASRNLIKKRLGCRCFPMNSSKYLKTRIHCEIYLSDSIKHNLMHISLHLIWLQEIRIKYVKRKPPQTFIRKKCHIPIFATSPCCGHSCFSWKGYFHRRLFFFSQIILPEIKKKKKKKEKKKGTFNIQFM